MMGNFFNGWCTHKSPVAQQRFVKLSERKDALFIGRIIFR